MIERIIKAVSTAFIASCVLFLAPRLVRAAQFIVAPASGIYEVGSTFDVSIYLDTEGQSVNAVEIALEFPKEKLQVVAPSSLGKSAVGLWVTQPIFDNQNGIVKLQGGIPGGVKASRNIIATLTFRVRSVGNGALRFQDSSKILLNDGKGTNVHTGSRGPIYSFVLPPPLGPKVSSPTHPDNSEWYKESSPVFIWQSDALVDGYSYSISELPVDNPDNIVDGKIESVQYSNLPDGVHYFHIKALKEGRWGGSTHFAVSVDSSPPAQFPIDVSPSARTSESQPMLRFTTTDNFSGLDRYELKVVPHKEEQLTSSAQKQLFFEVQSPHVTKLERGRYDVIVRAYDKAQNFRDVSTRVEIVPPFLRVVDGEGLRISDSVTIPWLLLIVLLCLILAATIYGIISIERVYRRIVLHHEEKILPKDVSKQLDELKRYKKKYGQLTIAILILVLPVVFLPAAEAEELLNPPYVSVLSDKISNQDIFYLGGKTNEADSSVKVHLQSLEDGTVQNRETAADTEGNWFYRHNSFLRPGKYIVWVEGRRGEETSPPGPQMSVLVEKTALQFGASRISFETMYASISSILFLIILFGLGFILLKIKKARQRKIKFMLEVREAEESIRRGFAVLKRDIELELEVVKRAKLRGELKSSEQSREDQLLRDLVIIEQKIGKEVWDIERTSI